MPVATSKRRVNRRPWLTFALIFIIYIVLVVMYNFFQVSRLEPLLTRQSMLIGDIKSPNSRCLVDSHSIEEANNLSVTSPVKIVMLGTYLPRQCGIATFSSDLRTALLDVLPHGSSIDIVAMVKKETDEVAYEVKKIIVEGDAEGYSRAAMWIDSNRYDFLILQHEYGIYGGYEGSHILGFVRQLQTPYMLVAHTVSLKPSIESRLVMNELGSRATNIISINPKGCKQYGELFGNSGKCVSIRHGIPDIPFNGDPNMYKSAFGLREKFVVLSFGLLGPGKGLEHVIDSMVWVKEKIPHAMLVILGKQHPHIQENYIKLLKQRVERNGLGDNVAFHSFFVSDEYLRKYLSMSDVFVTNYPDMSQVSSGTLSIALGASVACISTPYVYAKEVLGNGRGLLVDFGEPQDLGSEIVRILQDDEARAKLRCNGYRYTRNFIWKNVAKSYANLLEENRLKKAAIGEKKKTISGLGKGKKKRDQLEKYVQKSYADTNRVAEQVKSTMIAAARFQALKFMSLGTSEGRKKLLDTSIVTHKSGELPSLSLSNGFWERGHVKHILPVIKGKWETQGLSNNYLRLNIVVERGQIELLLHDEEGVGIRSGHLFGLRYIEYTYEDKHYAQSMTDHPEKHSMVPDSSTGCKSLVFETNLLANGNVEKIGSVVTTIQVCRSPVLDVEYTIKLGEGIVITKLKVSSFISSIDKGPKWGNLVMSSDNEMNLHEPICKASVDARSKFGHPGDAIYVHEAEQSKSKCQNNDGNDISDFKWLGAYSAKSNAVYIMNTKSYSHSYAPSGDASSTTQLPSSLFCVLKLNPSRGFEFHHDFSKAVLKNTKKNAEVKVQGRAYSIKQRSILVERSFRSKGEFMHLEQLLVSPSGMVAERHPSAPSNIGFVLRSLSLSLMNKEDTGLEAYIIDQLKILSALPPFRTHVSEFYDAFLTIDHLRKYRDGQDEKLLELDSILRPLFGSMLEYHDRYCVSDMKLKCEAAVLYGASMSGDLRHASEVLDRVQSDVDGEGDGDGTEGGHSTEEYAMFIKALDRYKHTVAGAESESRGARKREEAIDSLISVAKTQIEMSTRAVGDGQMCISSMQQYDSCDLMSLVRVLDCDLCI